MQGDFTRNTYNPSKQFLRVLMQQGRVQLDADWNEQVSILLGYMETLATDLIGPYGGPKNNCGFEIFPNIDKTLDDLFTANKITKDEKDKIKEQIKKDVKFDFLIGTGHYYVNGKLCQSQKYQLYSKQTGHPFSDQDKLEPGKHLVYLDVWERHMSYVEDEDELVPGIREVALGQADTTTRSQLTWQVKVVAVEDKLTAAKLKNNLEQFKTILENEMQPGTGLLKAQAKISTGADITNPCTISPDSRYRGAENQLYRVEVHTPGKAGTATFKWSRENGSVIFPVQQVNDTQITLEHLGWDDRSSLKPGDWVELIDDQYELQGRSESLCQVASINSTEMTVELKGAFSYSGNEQSPRILRRWDQQLKQGTITIIKNQWIALEEGIEIYFAESKSLTPSYTTGDYWLIPARTATGDVEWPQETTGGNLSPIAILPHGVEHQYAPLWIIEVDKQGKVQLNADCRCQFPSLCEIPNLLQLKTP